MKSGCLSILLKCCLLCAVIILFNSCAGPATPAARAAQSPALLAGLPPAHREAALGGRIVTGMSPEAVTIAMGRPDSVLHGRVAGTPAETWRYTTLRSMHTDYYARPRVLYDGRRYRTMAPGIVDMSPQLVPEVSDLVHFRNGRVVSWKSRHDP
jgi:hypothetical protein